MTRTLSRQPAGHLAWRALSYIAEMRIWETCERWRESGARWVYDPDTRGVVGLVKPGSDQQAVCVVYLMGSMPDFEVSDDFEDVLT